MSRKITGASATVLAIVALILIGYLVGRSADSPVGEAHAASPVKALDEREVYYPGTEDLAPDEMRVTACGTGMPNARPKQAAACWLVELGNGDKFFFDLGTGTMENLAALQPDWHQTDKVFISHLHSDHAGDFAPFHIGGWMNGRYKALNIYGPTGQNAYQQSQEKKVTVRAKREET